MVCIEGRTLLADSCVHTHCVWLFGHRFEVRAAFMFDMYDEDDSGVITLDELAKMINAAAPGSLVEQDLLALSRLSQNRKAADGAKADGGKAAKARQRKITFLFDDYLECARAIDEKDPWNGVTGQCRAVLGIE